MAPETAPTGEPDPVTVTAAQPPRLVQISGYWNDNQPWTRQVIVMPVDEATWRRIGEANRAD